MRLGKIYEILNEELPKLNIDFVQKDSTGYEINRLHEIRSSLVKITEIKSLSKNAYLLLGRIPIIEPKDKITWSQSVFNRFISEFNQLVTKAQLLKSVLEESVIAPVPGTIYLKLPEFNNIDELSNEVAVIETSFHQIFGSLDKNAKISLRGFDTGSSWLVFVAASGAVSFFAATLMAAMKVAQEGMKTKVILNQFQSSNDDATARFKINEAMNLIIDNVVTVEAQRLVDRYHANPNSKDGDEAIRVAAALKNLSKLFVDGADVQVPAITHEMIRENHPENAEEFNFEQESIKLETNQKEILKLAVDLATKKDPETSV